MSFAIEQHQCELAKAERGINCLISVDAMKGQISPSLLLQLTRAGLDQFPGAPVIASDGQYMLGVWQARIGNPEIDSNKLLAIFETLTNQAAVWNELLAQGKQRQVNSTQSDMLRFATRLSQHPNPF